MAWVPEKLVLISLREKVSIHVYVYVYDVYVYVYITVSHPSLRWTRMTHYGPANLVRSVPLSHWEAEA